MAVARKIAYNVAVSSVSKVLSTLLALVVIGLITRYLGQEGFGDYATVLAFLSFFASVADLGLYSISTREISRTGAHEEKIMGNIFTLRVISSLAIFIISPLVVIFFDYPLVVKEGIIIAAASFIFSSSYQVLNGIFQKNLAMDRVAVGELVGKISQVLLVVAAVKLNLGFSWIISSLLLNMLVSFIIVFFWSKKYLRFKLRFDFAYWKEFLKESMPIGVGAVIVFVYFKMDTIMLSVMKTSADVGIYNAAYKVLENLTFFPAMVIGLILPIMANTIFSDKRRFEEISNKTFKFFVLAVVPLIIGTLFLADGIISLIGGGQFAASADILRVLVFGIASIFFGNFFSNILIAGNLQKKLMLVYAGAAIFNVSANLIFIPKFSYTAAAYVSVLTEFFVAVVCFTVVAKKIKYYPKVEKKTGIILSGMIMAVFLFIFQNINFIIVALGSAVVYFVCLWIFRAVKTEELTSLLTKRGVEEYPGGEFPID
jgi:O-antigen/teichoic acid export membrane protein